MDQSVLTYGSNKAETCTPERIVDRPLLYRAALQGIYGKRTEFGRGSLTDALFVYLDGEPEPESMIELASGFRNRPLVCLTKAWKEQVETEYPDAVIYRRYMMKPSCCFIIPEDMTVPAGYLLTGMDETAFEKHPFSHGRNYSSWPAFQAEGSGAVAYHDGEIVAAASSFLTLNRELELDVFTKENHRRKNLAAACVAHMLQECMKRGFTVHWDAQNDISRHLAQKFGFEIETEYPVYWLRNEGYND